MMKDKVKETTAYSMIKVKEEHDDKITVFYGATTLPDRVKERLEDGSIIEGEILSKQALIDMKDEINDKSKFGGKTGSARTISLFHDRVLERNQKLEEAGYVKPTAKVIPHKDYAGEWALEVETVKNKLYVPNKTNPDYTPEKIQYKIDNDALGLSIEYNNKPNEERIVNLNGEKYRYIERVSDFQGFGYARANSIGNPTAIAIKELRDDLNKNLKGDKRMDEAKLKELVDAQTDLQSKIKELDTKLETAEEAKKKEMEAQKEEFATKIKELEVQKDEAATKIKEAMELMIEKLAKIKEPAKTKDGGNEDKTCVKVKEMMEIINNPTKSTIGRARVKEFDWDYYTELAEAKIKEQSEFIKTKLQDSGIRFESNRTLKVKCVGRSYVVEPTTKTKELLAKTKDVIDTGSMTEATYLQTNGFFADRYTPGITETFLMNDDLLKVMIKEQFAGGNDKYQWKIWTEFGSFDGDNTAAVDPDNTSVGRTKRDFIKLESPIREYRDGVEVTDFTQAHSAAAVGNLMGIEIERAAEYVRNSMDADLFKAKVDATAGWLGFNGLIGVADSSTYSTIYGRVRSTANKLLDSTLANTYVSAGAAISHTVVRTGYEKVLAHGAQLGNLLIAMHPTQVRKLFDAADNNISGTANTSSILRGQLAMAGAPADFGFNRSLIPHVDGIPIVRDYYCESSLAAQDMFAVIDGSSNSGFVLVTSKPLDVRGLAKVGTSESAYVSFWGQSVYKNVLNVFVQVSLT